MTQNPESYSGDYPPKLPPNHRTREIREKLREEATMGFERRIKQRGYLEPYEGSAEERYRNR